MSATATMRKPARVREHLCGVVSPLPAKSQLHQKHHQPDQEFNRLLIELEREQADHSHAVLPSGPRRSNKRRGLVALSATALCRASNALQSRATIHAQEEVAQFYQAIALLPCVLLAGCGQHLHVASPNFRKAPQITCIVVVENDSTTSLELAKAALDACKGAIAQKGKP